MPTPKKRKKPAAKVRPRVTSQRFEPGYRGFLVVQLRQTADSPMVNVPNAVPAIASLLNTYGVKPGRPLITSLVREELERREREWRIAPEKSLSWYWRLDTRHLEPDQIEELRKALEKLPNVGLAYLDPPGGPPPASPACNQLVTKRHYLKPAPRGIDAIWAWTQAGVSGQGVRIVDLESGWHSHPDLPPLQPLAGVPVEVDGDIACKHGTMVQGILVALKNLKGGVGIAFGATISVASPWRLDPTGAPSPVSPNACSRPSDFSLGGHVADTIVAVLPHLTPGDVLLLEVQKPDISSGLQAMPTELVDADFIAIESATNQGIVVVECAGNNAADLDAFPVLDRNNSQFKDSGAIMVAGCASKVSTKIVSATQEITGHVRWAFSNFGSRIDCHAWGENVATTSINNSLGSTCVTNFFGTSSAAAIVAGAAAVVQSARKASGKAPLTPADMRRVLRATGTPQFPGPEEIGTMPDLRKAIPKALALP